MAIPPVSGKTSERELLFLIRLAQLAPLGDSAEVGALYGRSALAWIPARRGKGQILIVDDLCRRELLQNLPKDATPIKGSSWEVADKLPDLAFCFIDADHSHDAFSRDLAHYTRKIVPGGIIAFHDYGDERFAVTALVDEWHLDTQWQCMGKMETIIAFRRPVSG